MLWSRIHARAVAETTDFTGFKVVELVGIEFLSAVEAT
jgi:hypothetical protein